MRKSRKLSAVTALGSLTAAVALLAGSPASAQTAPGGGSFPGSFLVPGTNTSIKVGGFAKIVGIYDMTAKNGDTLSVSGASLRGSAGYTLHGATRIHARQSNLNVDTRTPTAYGDLTTFILIDGFGGNPTVTENQSNTWNTRIVYAYGTLGPFLAGQWVSLWADTDAIPESVDPTGFIAVNDGLSNRQPQFRYTFAAPGGFSAALSIENPEAEGYSNNPLVSVNSNPTLNTALPATSRTFTTNSLGGIDRYPDIIARGRIDQAWGHAALTGMYRDIKVISPANLRASKSAYGLQASGHLNTFGKDSLKFTAQAGKGLGHYMSDYRDTVANGLVINTNAAGTVLIGDAVPYAYGANVGYTHWWTGALRSSLDAGYSRNQVENSLLTSAAALNGYDKRHVGGRVNLIWSPVPQVDLGVEYDYVRRTTAASNGAVQANGNVHRLEVESVFKF